jgi:hypothetical protein
MTSIYAAIILNPGRSFESVAHDENVLAPYQFKNLRGSDGNGNYRIDRRLCDIVWGKCEHAVSKPGHAAPLRRPGSPKLQFIAVSATFI